MSSVSSSRIKSVQFYVNNSESNSRESYVVVKATDPLKNGIPTPNGVNSPYTGTVELMHKCATCHNKKQKCPGHSGNILLKYPLLSPLFLSYIRNWLKVVCEHCGSLLYGDDVVMKYPEGRRLKELAKILKQKNEKCFYCGKVHHLIRKDQTSQLAIVARIKDANDRIKEERNLFPHEIERIFSRVTEETVLRLGEPLQSHPSNFVLRSIRVPAVTIRPEVKKLGGTRSSNDDLTVLLQSIIKINASMPSAMNLENLSDIDRKNIAMLEYAYYRFVRPAPKPTKIQIGGKQTVIGKSSNLRSAAVRLCKKEGMIRKLILGKRVHVIVRSVITCNPYLAIDEVGVPLVIAKSIQQIEVVQEFNRSRLMVYFLNGTKKYPGCTHIKKKSTGGSYRINTLRDDYTLEIGDEIMRDTIDGDVFNYNRNPTLWSSCISGNRAKIIMDPEILVFQMNVLACVLYNADFDGDTMSGIMQRDIMARNEVTQISGVPNWLINAENSQLFIGEVQDSIIGCRFMTMSDVVVDRHRAMQIMARVNVDPSKEMDVTKPYYTGRELMSLVLPRINFSGTAKIYDEMHAPYMNHNPDDVKIKIVNGEIVSGSLDKKAIGKGGMGNIFHIIAQEYGRNRALIALYEVQQLAIAFNECCGFTIGMSDLLISKDANEEIKKIESSIMNESKVIVNQLNEGKIIPPLGVSIRDFYEEKQKAVLQMSNELVQVVLNDIDLFNSCYEMIMMGAKGSISNMMFMASSIGLVVINDERPKTTFSKGRTLPYFQRYDEDADARGYVLNSFMSGMTTTEWVFQAMNNRFQIIQKALTTAVTGYENRKSVRNLESDIVTNTLMVAKRKNIVQMLFGDDGIDPRFMELVSFSHVVISDDAFKAAYFYEGESGGKVLSDTFKQEYEVLLADRATYRKVFMSLERQSMRDPMKTSCKLPVNVRRIIDDSEKVETPSDEELVMMVERVSEFTKSLSYIYTNFEREAQGKTNPQYMVAATFLMASQIRIRLCAAEMKKNSMGMESLELILNRIIHKYMRALMSPGTAAGILSAQSISSAFTQYVLDAPSKGDSTSRRGIERFKELLNVRGVDKSFKPAMCVVLKSGTDARLFLNEIEMSNLRGYILNAQLFYEKFGEPEHPAYAGEASWIKDFVANTPMSKPPADLTKWCIRLRFNKAAICMKNMTVEAIYYKLRVLYPTMYITYTMKDSIIMRIYLRVGTVKTMNIDNMRDFMDAVLGTIIRGVDGIQTGSVDDATISEVTDDGSIKAEKKKVIFTTGTNLYGIFQRPEIDVFRTWSNNLEEIFNMFGIEAARMYIVHELRPLLSEVNYQHFLMYADEMTYPGRLTSIEKSGLNSREEDNVLLRLSNSSPVQVIEEATTAARVDKVHGVSASLIMGQAPLIGTNYNQFAIDTRFIRENVKSVDDVLDTL